MAGPADELAALIESDNAVIVFRTERSDVRGRLIRLGSVADVVIAQHGLGDVASDALGQALALAALIGSVLPADGKIIMQARSDGAVPFLVADYESPGRVRGYAREHALAADARPETRPAFGNGHLAITMELGVASDRYQGVVALDGSELESVAAEYFENRESLPTFIRLATGREVRPNAGGADAESRWRAGGLMIQSVDARNLADDDAAGSDDADREAWTRARILAATAEDHELIDPNLSAAQLLLRLFHEDGVRVEQVLPISNYCRCSRDRVADVLRSFGAAEVSDMRDAAGSIAVTCEFCATAYTFTPEEIGAEAPDEAERSSPR